MEGGTDHRLASVVPQGPDTRRIQGPALPRLRSARLHPHSASPNFWMTSKTAACRVNLQNMSELQNISTHKIDFVLPAKHRYLDLAKFCHLQNIRKAQINRFRTRIGCLAPAKRPTLCVLAGLARSGRAKHACSDHSGVLSFAKHPHLCIFRVVTASSRAHLCPLRFNKIPPWMTSRAGRSAVACQAVRSCRRCSEMSVRS